MLALTLILLLAAVLFGLGFVVKWLFIAAAVIFVVWLIGMLVGRGRWYGL